jgi:CHASE3 domain sensor protein
LQVSWKQKRKASEKLEKLNQAKEQLEKIQRAIDEMKEQENNSLWRDSPHQNASTKNSKRKLLHRQWNLAIRRPRIATTARATNSTMATEI